ncbi:MAG: hypothetical protein JXJ20_05130 [Anaerolineae bacterium]|jgi:signal transduction histidine kinase|nr:hypothetical protein [Anaerolineae bacterium]
MNPLHSLAFQAWCHVSSEGLLVVDPLGAISLINPCLRELFELEASPHTVEQLLQQAEPRIPGLRAALDIDRCNGHIGWGSLCVRKHPPRRVTWEQIPLLDDEQFLGSLTVFTDATVQGKAGAVEQSFLSMISHDLRTPLSTILGFAELLYNNQGGLSGDEQKEFAGHIIKNANELSRYTQIALDIMFLEADSQRFESQPVLLGQFVEHWLSDAVHRFPVERLVLHTGVERRLVADVAPGALHKILYILVEFALEESQPEDMIDISVEYEESQAHIIFRHTAPGLSAAEAAVLFQLMRSRDLSESSRPYLHRMQLYVATLLTERQGGCLTLRKCGIQDYELDLVLPLAFM